MATPSGVLFYQPDAQPLSGSGSVQPSMTASFYITGTLTAANVYQDGALSTPFTQPVTANATTGIFPAIYLDPSIIYRVILKTSGGTTISDTDPYLPLALYPRTALEVAAGVSPSKYQFPPGDLRRYGAVGNGTTDDAAALTSAFATGHRVLGGGPEYIYTYKSNITIPFRANGAIVADMQFATFRPTTSAGSAPAIQNTNATSILSTTVTGGAVLGSVSLTLGSVSGLSVGNILAITSTNQPTYYGLVKSIVGGVVTLDTASPLNYSGTVNATATTPSTVPLISATASLTAPPLPFLMRGWDNVFTSCLQW